MVGVIDDERKTTLEDMGMTCAELLVHCEDEDLATLRATLNASGQSRFDLLMRSSGSTLPSSSAPVPAAATTSVSSTATATATESASGIPSSGAPESNVSGGSSHWDALWGVLTDPTTGEWGFSEASLCVHTLCLAGWLTHRKWMDGMMY